MTVVTRFAPSPTGPLHLGHAYAALVAHDAAQRAGGRFLLRIEDIDPTRCRSVYRDAILTDLRWLGFKWHGAVRTQSEHLADYRGVLADLASRGLVYPCFCSRSDIAAAASAPHRTGQGIATDPYGVALYPGTCRETKDAQARSAAGEPYALRLNMNRALQIAAPSLSFMELGRGRLPCRPARFGDIVLARKDAPASYHLCATHDDALQGVTLVTRGEDLRDATDVQRLLQELMGWPEPSYRHHAILTDAEGRRLAKRDNANTIAGLREAGHTPASVHTMILKATASVQSRAAH